MRKRERSYAHIHRSATTYGLVLCVSTRTRTRCRLFASPRFSLSLAFRSGVKLSSRAAATLQRVPETSFLRRFVSCFVTYVRMYIYRRLASTFHTRAVQVHARHAQVSSPPVRLTSRISPSSMTIKWTRASCSPASRTRRATAPSRRTKRTTSTKDRQ